MAYETIRLDRQGPVARVTLSRPEVRNAFNEVMIAELTEIFAALEEDADLRCVVLTGDGKAFCAGADLHWMGRVINYSWDENLADSMALDKLMRAMYDCRRPLIGRINGAAIGGGAGLVAVCDVVIAAESAVFSFSEVKIGLVPACIAPFVLKRVGERYGREYFITGKRLTAHEAEACGLVNHAVPDTELDSAVDEMVAALASSGPSAISTAKRMVREVAEMSLDDAGPYTAKMITELRLSDEGQEGMKAFLERRAPGWRPG